MSAIAADAIYEIPPEPPAPAQSLPAVSAINGKLDISGGAAGPVYDAVGLANRFAEAYRIRGAVSIPVSHSVGLQLDGVAGSIGGSFYGHGAGHLFWRDPDVALFGGYASYTTWDGIESYRTGLEGELYANRFTVSAVVGGEWGTVRYGLFSIADVSYYATDNLKLKIGHRFTQQSGNVLAAGAEYQFHSTDNVGFAAYVDGRIGENSYQSVFAGLKMYFGQNKSLIRRHREDDPDIHDEPDSVLTCTDEVYGPTMVDSRAPATTTTAQCGSSSTTPSYGPEPE